MQLANSLCLGAIIPRLSSASSLSLILTFLLYSLILATLEFTFELIYFCFNSFSHHHPFHAFNHQIIQFSIHSASEVDMPVEQVPQIVLLTFDDSVNDLNKQLYQDLFERGRVNPNGCPIAATFYVSHEWTDYSQVQNLYSDGHEMASHTVS